MRVRKTSGQDLLLPRMNETEDEEPECQEKVSMRVEKNGAE